MRGDGKVILFRNVLDCLTQEQVTWDPYTEHRDVQSLHMLTYYRGFVRYATCMMPYLPSRVERQFGYIQGIPLTRDLLGRRL